MIRSSTSISKSLPAALSLLASSKGDTLKVGSAKAYEAVATYFESRYGLADSMSTDPTFLASLAEAMGVRAIGIVLSGYSNDGSKGCMHIQAKGGKIFAQDESAEVPSMPLNAQASSCVDFVMPLNKIPGKLKRLAAALKS